MHSSTHITPLRWAGGHIDILDQRLLPNEVHYLHCADVDSVAEAIRSLAVRGAPLIGITAAYGMALAAGHAANVHALYTAHDVLAGTRPTAVNLFWALHRCREVIDALPAETSMAAVQQALLTEARLIHQHDADDCSVMAAHGAALLQNHSRILTHCNAGALATGGIGTALGVIRAACAAGKVEMVWVDETRPLLQGARLTAWELREDAIPYRVICDNMAAALMASGQVDVVIVGADRITTSGDFANKIGTYGLAVLAHAHGIPFYVAAPWTTVDLSLEHGTQIPVEFRAEEEICQLGDRQLAPEGSRCWNPAFDVTPARLVTRFISERGVHALPLHTP